MCCGVGCGVLFRGWLCLGGCWVGVVGLWIIRCRRCLLIVLMMCGFWVCRWVGLGLGLVCRGRLVCWGGWGGGGGGWGCGGGWRRGVWVAGCCIRGCFRVRILCLM